MFVASAALVAATSSLAAGAQSSPQPLAPVFQKAAAIGWSRWAFGIPAADNPLADTTKCTVDEHGPVWFLPAATDVNQDTNCSVPQGKWLVLGPGGNFGFKVTGDGSNAAELLAAEKTATDGIGVISATIDGTPVAHLERYRTAVAFTLVLPADNLLGAPAGPTLAAADMYIVVIPPLGVGNHVVTEYDKFTSGPSVGFEAGRTLHLTVTPGPH